MANSTTTSVGLPIVDYKLATQNQTQLMAQFQKTPQYTQDVAYYQANVGKITSVTQFLNNYKILNFALSAYGMQPLISQKGILQKLLTQDPTSSTSLAQKMGNQSYIAFAKAFASLKSDGGAGIKGAESVNSTIAHYTQTQFQQWLGTRDNDAALTTALAAKATLQDAVNISDVGALFAQFQKTLSQQQIATYFTTHMAQVKTASDLEADSQLLNVALTAYGVDPSTVSTDTVHKLLTQSPLLKTSVAANNPAYQAFANAFVSLQPGGSGNATSGANISSMLASYQQKVFAQVLTTNTKDQNVQMFGAAAAAKITQILDHARTESGLSLATTYYAAHIGSATSANKLAADPQLLSVALGAYGLGGTSAATVQKLLTQDPNAADSLAQKSVQYTAFAKAFSYANVLGAPPSAAKTKITSVQTAYQDNQLQSTIISDVSLANAQSTRNTNVHESAVAPLNLYQMLGDANISTVLFGAYNLPAMVGAYDPDQQVEVISHAGFKPESVNSGKAIDSLMQRYMASSAVQPATTSPLLALFQPSDPTQPISFDISSIFANQSTNSTALASSPTGYLLNLI